VITQSGTPGDGSIGRPGGKTWSYSNVVHADRSPKVFWGVATEGVRLSLDGADFSAPGEIMAFDPAESDLPNGLVVWSGQTTIVTQNSGPQTAFTRMEVRVTEQVGGATVPLTLATDEGLPTDVGAMVEIVDSADAIDVNLLTLASLTNGSGYQPHLDFFDPLTDQSQDGMAHVSVSFGFYYENVAPFLTTNVNNALNEGDAVVISTANLAADDYESEDADITFVVGPPDGQGGNVGGPPQWGTLWLDDGLGNLTALGVEDSFTQDDLVNNRLSYEHLGNDVETIDAFQFSVFDGEGAIASDGPFTVFSHNFNITLLNDPPVPVNDSGLAAIDGTYSGVLSATDNDTDPSNFTYTIIDVDVGSAVLLDATAGTFDYTGPVGPATAQIQFRVNDGTDDSLTDGIFTVTVPENMPPVANDDSDIGRYATPYTGTFSATDPESPELTFSVISTDIGTATILDPIAGTFELTFPQDHIGNITIEFQVFDGEFFSDNNGIFVVTIPDGSIDIGDLLITNRDKLILHNRPANTNYVLSEGGLFSTEPPPPSTPGDRGDQSYGLNAVAYGGPDRIYVMDHQNGVLRVDPLTGEQFVVTDNTFFNPGNPGNMAIEDDEHILFTDLGTGLVRVNTTAGVATVLTPADQAGDFNVPASVTVAPNSGLIYVGNAGSFAGGVSNIFEIQPDDGTYTILPSANGLVNIPLSIEADSDSSIYALDAGGFAGGINQILKIDVPAGTETSISSGTNLDSEISDFTTAPDGMIYFVTPNPAALVAIDPDTGVQTVIPTETVLTSPTDITAIFGPDLLFGDRFENLSD